MYLEHPNADGITRALSLRSTTPKCHSAGRSPGTELPGDSSGIECEMLRRGAHGASDLYQTLADKSAIIRSRDAGISRSFVELCGGMVVANTTVDIEDRAG